MAYDTIRNGLPAQPIDQRRVIEKLDEHMAKNDYDGAERHLLYWLAEAQAVGDQRGELMLRNELVGHFRKTGNKEQAFAHARAALDLVDALDFGATISAGTTFTNVATAYNAFGENAKSLELFGRALALYENSPGTDPTLLGGLYNNMALTCVALERLDEADELYAKALSIMAQVEHGELEQAITYLNMADAAVARAQAQGAVEGGFELADVMCEATVEAYLEEAYGLLNTPEVPRDGYYAFVCEKCASTFAHYGFFLQASELRQRAHAIFEGQ